MGAQDVLNGPWAMIPEKLLEIQSVYARHLHGQAINLRAVEERLGKPLSNERKPYQVVKGVALIELNGIIAKRMNLLTQISGGVSTQLLKGDFEQAFSDPEVKSIILVIDSPGGTIDGTEELANSIYAARLRNSKPIVSYVDGLMASAAYWIGAAADRIYINGQTAQVGSIGVVATHVDYSKWEEEQGIKTTEVYAGRYKRMVSEYKTLSKEGREYMQDQVDQFYSIFVNTVSRYRGEKLQISDSDPISWANGKIFIGRQAVDMGLADGMASLERLVSDLSLEGRDGLPLQEARALIERQLQETVAGVRRRDFDKVVPEEDGGTILRRRLSLLDKMSRHYNPVIRMGYLVETHGFDFGVTDAWRRSFGRGAFPSGLNMSQLCRVFGEVYPQYRSAITRLLEG